jgi:hypothetical protein
MGCVAEYMATVHIGNFQYSQELAKEISSSNNMGGTLESHGHELA